MTRAITVDVIDDDGTTVVDTLESDRHREWLDDLSAEGSHSLEIQVGHADQALLTDGRLVRFSVNGAARWQGLVEAQEPVIADPGGRQSGRISRIGGRGSLAVLERAVIYPELGLGRVSPDTRYMNFASLDFDDSLWGNAVELKAQNDTDSSKPWYGAPQGWKDRAAQWVGPSGGMTPPVTPGDIYLRGSFTIGSGEGGEYRFMLSADDEFELYVDGNKVSAQKGVGLWGVTHTVDLLLDEGSHLAAVKVTNLNRPVAATNVFGFIMSVYKLLGGGDTLGDVVSRSSSGTKMLAYPSTAPGMTPGQILDVFLSEAQARGTLTELDWDFTATLDSNGDAWPSEIDVSFPVQTSLLDVVKHLVEEHACDVAMAADSLTLHAYVSKGADLSATVEAEYGVDIGRLAFRRSAPTANVALSKTAENRWYESTETTSTTSYGRREIGLTLGSAPSDDAALRQTAAFFEDHAFPQEAITDLQLEAVNAVPGDDFVVGDIISVLGDPYRVHGLRTSEDEAGQPIYTPELLAVDPSAVFHTVGETTGTGNSAPDARITAPASAEVGDSVALSASLSSDPDSDPITYAWAITSKPSGSTATLTSSSTVSSGFTPDVAGSYVIRLTVTDDNGASDITTATVTATAVAPDIAGEPATATVEARLLSDADVKFVGTFESTNWQDLWGVGTFNNSSRFSVASHAITGANGKSAKLTNSANAQNGPGATCNFRNMDAGSGVGIPEMDEAYLRYRVYFGPSFAWSNAAGEGGGKLPGLAGKVGLTYDWAIGGGGKRWNQNVEVTGSSLQNADGFSARLLWQKDHGLSSYLYCPSPVGSASTNSYFGYATRVKTTVGGGTNATFDTSGWNDVEMRVVMNTPGTANGIFEVWLNGTKGLSLTNVMWRGAGRSNLHISQIIATFFFGGGPDDYPDTNQSIYIDDFVVSSAYIGPRV